MSQFLSRDSRLQPLLDEVFDESGRAGPANRIPIDYQCTLIQCILIQYVSIKGNEAPLEPILPVFCCDILNGVTGRSAPGRLRMQNVAVRGTGVRIVCG